MRGMQGMCRGSVRTGEEGSIGLVGQPCMVSSMAFRSILAGTVLFHIDHDHGLCREPFRVAGVVGARDAVLAEQGLVARY